MNIIMQFPMKNIQFEISGICNAKCPYCITGQKNNKKEKTGKFVTASEFKLGMEMLYTKKIIDNMTVIALFNYGEPLLNPDLEKIIDILDDYGNKYEISTNGSILLEEKMIKKMTGLLCIQFSMCGMSQNSYNKIHGFHFDKIKSNVTNMVNKFHQFSPNTECILKLQVYQFNEHEVPEAMRFAVKNGMNVIPIHALYANLYQQMEFVEKYEKTKKLPENSEQLWYYLPELLNQHSKDEVCPQQQGLVVDDELNIALCCMVTKDMAEYKICSLSELSFDLLNERIGYSFCKKCINLGVSKSICNTPSYKRNAIYDIILEKNRMKKIIILGDGILVDSFKKFYDKNDRYEVKRELDTFIFDKFENRLEVFLVLADRNWWKVNFEKYGLQENIDFMIYNTYYR